MNTSLSDLRPPPNQRQPYQRMIVAVDIEGSTSRNNAQQGHIRDAMYQAVESALVDCGITQEHRDEFSDRGDGVMVLIRPVDSIPKPLLIRAVVPALRARLEEYARRHPGQRLRLRVAIHAGDVLSDGRAPYGEDVNLTTRLLDAPEFKEQLAESAEPLVLVVSDQVYRSAVCQGYDGIDAGEFKPLVRVCVGHHTHRGWVRVPAETHNGNVTQIDRVS
ncbi:hypothetical protein [Actinophytocola oryzae]|uniref:Class 3 adenylate cyclase n=1 Tax=Actinophytocola oryzae TaxID=502181 RepID=A0A4R7VUQ5_9PSEU|nr:hypothetical protein [Actinophytocola oryzae]TDV53710.1 class 3 adenylate cyclase [Actinophytocola oryzae]